MNLKNTLSRGMSKLRLIMPMRCLKGEIKSKKHEELDSSGGPQVVDPPKEAMVPLMENDQNLAIEKPTIEWGTNQYEDSSMGPEVDKEECPTNQDDSQNQQRLGFGYLFLKRFFYRLRLNYICEELSKKYGFDADLCSVVEILVYRTILYPLIKIEESIIGTVGTFLEPLDLNICPEKLVQALEVLPHGWDYIQSRLYRNYTALLIEMAVNHHIQDLLSVFLYDDCMASFRIMEYEEPGYETGVLSSISWSETSIRGYWIIGFLSQLICGMLSLELGSQYSSREIKRCLSSMNLKVIPCGYRADYRSTDLTELLLEHAGLSTDICILSPQDVQAFLDKIKQSGIHW